MDVPDGHIRQGRCQKEQCQEPDQQSVLHHVRSRGRRVFQVCTTVNHIGNVILLLPLKPTALPTRNARQRTVRVAGQISVAIVKQARFTPIVATSGANVQPMAGVSHRYHCARSITKCNTLESSTVLPWENTIITLVPPTALRSCS